MWSEFHFGPLDSRGPMPNQLPQIKAIISAMKHWALQLYGHAVSVQSYNCMIVACSLWEGGMKSQELMKFTH